VHERGKGEWPGAAPAYVLRRRVLGPHRSLRRGQCCALGCGLFAQSDALHLARLDRSFTFTREVVDLLLADSPLAEALPRDLIAQVAASAFFGLAVMDLVGANIDIDGMTALANTLLDLLRS
jgi:hypothetical protein